MKKIPIELFGAASSAEPRGIIVWNGLELSVCSEIPMSFFDVNLRHLKEVTAQASYYSVKAYTAAQGALTIATDVNNWYKENEGLVQEFAGVALSTKNLVNQRDSSLTEIFTLQRDLTKRASLAKEVFDIVTSGKLIVSSYAYDVSYNSVNYTYTISRKVRPAPKVVGSGAVSVREGGGKFTISFDPNSTFKILAGNGLSLLSTGAYNSLNLNNIIVGGRGCTVTQNVGSFTVGVRDNAVISANNKIKVSRTHEGYLVSLDLQFRDSLRMTYKAGDGIESFSDTLGTTYRLAGNLVPRFVAGSNVELQEVMNGDRRGYKVNLTAPAFPTAPKFESEWPLLVGTSVNGGVSVTQFAIDKEYAEPSIQSLQAINKSLTNSDARASNVTIFDLSEDTKQKLNCPVLSLFNMAATNNVATSALDNFDSNSAELIRTIGVRPRDVILPVDITTLLANVTLDSNGVTSSSSRLEFDAYLFAENYIREVAGNANFTLRSEFKDTKFKLLEVDVANAVAPTIVSSERLRLDYNQAWDIVSNLSAGGKRLCASVADMDFYFGTLRNGQANSSPVILLGAEYTDLQLDELKFGFDVIKIDTKEEADGSIVYEISIVDSYTNNTSVYRWKKKQKYDVTLDRMQELSSGALRPIGRFISRMVAQYGYATIDTAHLIKELITFDTSSVNAYYDYLTDLDFVKESGVIDNAPVISVESVADGNVSLRFKPFSPVRPDINVNVLDIVKGMRIFLKFKIKPLSTGDFPDVMDCDWIDRSLNLSPNCYSVRTPYVLDGDVNRQTILLGEQLPMKASEYFGVGITPL